MPPTGTGVDRCWTVLRFAPGRPAAASRSDDSCENSGLNSGVRSVDHCAGECLGSDRAVVRVGRAHAGPAVAGEDAVLAHYPEDAAHRGADAALLTEPRPDLAVAFAHEEVGCKHGADLAEDLLVGEEGLRAALRAPSACDLWRLRVARERH